VPKQEPPAVTEGVVDIDGTLLATGSGEPRPVWDVRGLTSEQGRSLLASQGFIVLGQKPIDKTSNAASVAASSIIEDVQKCGGDTVRFVLAKPVSEDEIARAPAATVAPNLVGMPMARAIKLASADGFRVKTAGSGEVTKQFPEAGSPLSNVRSISTELAPSPTLTLFGNEQ
jgi:beta-lactam-binding protein with PASTA domain